MSESRPYFGPWRIQYVPPNLVLPVWKPTYRQETTS